MSQPVDFADHTWYSRTKTLIGKRNTLSAIGFIMSAGGHAEGACWFDTRVNKRAVCFEWRREYSNSDQNTGSPYLCSTSIDVDPMLIQRWANVCDVGSTSNQYWVSLLCLCGVSVCICRWPFNGKRTVYADTHWRAVPVAVCLRIFTQQGESKTEEEWGLPLFFFLPWA